MNIEVVEERENKLLERRELKLRLDHEKGPTPSKEEVIREVAGMYKVPETHVELRYIFTVKGKPESVARVMVYEKPVRKEEKAKEEVKEESKAEEAKTEVVSEESKEEGKKEEGESEAQADKSE